MATRAQITIDGVAGSNDDAALNVQVQLGNNGLGAESAWAWAVLDQPAGATDVLTNPAIADPKFTPTREGSYLLELVVNAGLADEKTDRVLLGVRHLRTRMRIPAAGEEIEAGARGWQGELERTLRMVDQATDGVVLVAVTAAAGLVRGDVVYIAGGTRIKVGLTGEDHLPTVNKAPATNAGLMARKLYVLEGTPAGSGTPGNGAIVRCRALGRFPWMLAGAPTTGDPVYVADTGGLALLPGANPRVIGVAGYAAGGQYDVIVEG